MEEITTTEAPVDAGVVETQPVEAVATEAVETPTTQPEGQTEQVEPTQVDELDTWAKAKGLELDSDNTRKAAKMAREAERAMHEKARKASELEKSFVAQSDEIAEQVAESTGQDPETIKRLQRIEVKEAVRDFWDSNPDARKYEADMVKLVAERPHLAGDLDALYATAVIMSGGLDAVKSQGKREALESLAQKQQATAPMGNATNSGTAPKSKPFNELSISEMEAQLGFVRQ